MPGDGTATTAANSIRPDPDFSPGCLPESIPRPDDTPANPPWRRISLIRWLVQTWAKPASLWDEIGYSPELCFARICDWLRPGNQAMQAIRSIPPLNTLSDGQRDALVRLLADEDAEIFRNIHDAILAQGPAALAWLAPYRLSPDPGIRRRVRALVNRLQVHKADTDFLSFCLTQGERLDFEQGLFLLAQTVYPDLNPEGYRALLDGYAEELRNRVADLKVPQRVLGSLNRLLFLQLGFRGNAADYYDPDNSYLNRIMDRRTGNPIGMSAVYLGIGRRLGLPIAGVGLPGHFLCRYQDAANEVYVDPFNGGRFLTRTDCVHQLVRSNRNLSDDYLSPLSPKQMLFRTVNNLHQIYQQRNAVADSLRMRGYLVALSKDVRKGHSDA